MKNEKKRFESFNLKNHPIMLVFSGICIGFLIAISLQVDTKPIPIDTDNIKIYFTYPKSFRPIGFVTCESVLVSLINSAKKSIYILAYNWTSINIANAIAAAHRRGVEVRIVLDKENENRDNPAVEIVSNNSKDLKIRRISGISHNKVMIIDEAIVSTGSYNFSKSANQRNDENLVVISSVEIASKYIECWHRIREYSFALGESINPEKRKWQKESLMSSKRESNYKNNSRLDEKKLNDDKLEEAVDRSNSEEKVKYKRSGAKNNNSGRKRDKGRNQGASMYV